MRAAYYWNVLHNIVLSPNLQLFSDYLHNLDFSVFMIGRAVKRLVQPALYLLFSFYLFFIYFLFKNLFLMGIGKADMHSRPP